MKNNIANELFMIILIILLLAFNMYLAPMKG